MAFPKVYVNGKLAGERDYGYSSFRIDATPYVKVKGENVVAVRVDTTKHGTRWYPGAGIYRKVTLHLCKPVHFAEWGIQVTTPKVTDELATVKVLATIENHGDRPVPATIEISACDPGGNTCTSPIRRTITLHSGPNSVEQNIDIDHPNRWDVDSPNLYAVSTKIEQADIVVDSQRTKFGIRSCEFTADDGFH